MRSSYLLHSLPLPGFTVADFTDPTKKSLPNLPLPNFPVAQFSVAQFTANHTNLSSASYDLDL